MNKEKFVITLVISLLIFLGVAALLSVDSHNIPVYKQTIIYYNK